MGKRFEHLDNFRRIHPAMGMTPPGTGWGYFEFQGLRIISSGPATDRELGDWEHVSVSLPNRCPRWNEMCEVKRLFWTKDELVLQFHQPEKDYVNQMEHCLHLWKPINQTIQLPPQIMV